MITDDMTLGQAKDWLRARVEKGDRCPCCKQRAQIYKRSLYNAMALNLIRIYKLHTREFLHVKEIIDRSGSYFFRGGDWHKMLHWGLLEKPIAEEKKRNGYWRITKDGILFVEKKIRVMSHIRLYDDRFLGFAGEPVYIDECLDKEFDYDELMNN